MATSVASAGSNWADFSKFLKDVSALTPGSSSPAAFEVRVWLFAFHNSIRAVNKHLPYIQDCCAQSLRLLSRCPLLCLDAVLSLHAHICELSLDLSLGKMPLA